jgi:hypothetical protein
VGTRLYHLGRPRKFVYGRAMVYHLNHPMLGRATSKPATSGWPKRFVQKKSAANAVWTNIWPARRRMNSRTGRREVAHSASQFPADRRRHRRSMRQTGGGTAPARPAGLAGRALRAAVCASHRAARRAFFDTGPSGEPSWQFILRAARFIRREKIQIVHGHHGRDIWPAIFAARLAGTKPKLVLTRHMAKSPGSWASRRFLLGQCDA